MRLFRDRYPALPRHASTQTAVHDLDGALYLQDLGCETIVLARELTLSEMEKIASRLTTAGAEAFVHGAHCMSVSGACYLSAMLGGRSGNRGLCAQPCRLDWRCGKGDHVLSLKDMSLLRHAQEMADAGITTFKIEGRMKRPEYVAAVVTACREALTGEAYDEDTLRAVFSRSGFTDGYLTGKRDKTMFGYRTKDDVQSADKVLKSLAALYEKETPRVGVSMAFSLTETESALTVLDGENARTVTGDAPEKAINRALDAASAEKNLVKTGGTPFAVTDFTADIAPGYMLPASALNALRRDALAALAAMRTEIPERREGTFVPAERIKNPTEPPRFTVSIYRAGQLTDALVNEGVETVYVPLELLPSVEVEKYRGRTKFAAVLPRVWRTADEEGLREQLRTAKERGVECAVLGNLGHFALVRGLDMELRGDFGLNVFNSAALRFLKEQGLSGATLSFELRHEQLRDISKCIPCEAIVYGRLPLMITENCIVANEFGCRHFKGRCGALCADSACAGAPELTDRVGERFPVLHAYGCRSELQNGKTLWLADKPEYRKIGLTYARLRFTTESAEECVRVLRAYKGREEYTPKDITRGLFYRGVE